MRNLDEKAQKLLKPWADAAAEKTAAVKALEKQIDQRRRELVAAQKAAVEATTPAGLAKENGRIGAARELIDRLLEELTTARLAAEVANRERDGRRAAWQRREGRFAEIDAKIVKLQAERQHVAEKLANERIFS